MPPFRRDGQPDLGPTPLEFVSQQPDKKGGKRKPTVEAPAGPEGMTPMEFAAWQATQPAQTVAPAPGTESSQGGAPGVSPLAKPLEIAGVPHT